MRAPPPPEKRGAAGFVCVTLGACAGAPRKLGGDAEWNEGAARPADGDAEWNVGGPTRPEGGAAERNDGEWNVGAAERLGACCG